MDITYFVTWFIDQVFSMFSWFFSLLASIQFCGTNLLDVIIAIFIFTVLIPVILTIGKNSSVVASRSERVIESRKERNTTNEKK